jgi:hypothetical protein
MSSNSDELTAMLDRFTGQEPISAEQSIIDRNIRNRALGSSGAGLGNSGLSEVLTRGGVTRRAVDDMKERYYSNIPGLSQLDNLISETLLTEKSLAKVAGKVVSSNARSIYDLILGQATLTDTVNVGQEILMDIGETQLTVLDMMREFRQSISSATDDMIQPGSSLAAAAEMLGIDRSTSIGLDASKIREDENKYDDFISELVSSGVSMEDATAAADAVDIDKDKSISAAELAKYDSSENTVVNKVIKDPRFRNRLVKRRPYSSIYGDDFSSQFNQTEFVDSSLALDSEAFNADNVAFEQ